MKTCTGDNRIARTYHVETTPANEHDVTATSKLMHSEEEDLNGTADIGADKRPDAIKRNKQGKKSSTKSTEDHHIVNDINKFS